MLIQVSLRAVHKEICKKKKKSRDTDLIACEQALLFGQARPVSLAQTGELASRLLTSQKSPLGVTLSLS